MTHFEIWGWMIVVIIICIVIYGLYLLAKNVYKYGVPRSIPPAPIQRYQRPTPTIETQYGRDLFHASIKMYKHTVNGPGPYDSKITKAVRDAGILLSEVNEKCFEIDKEKADETAKQNSELFNRFKP